MPGREQGPWVVRESRAYSVVMRPSEDGGRDGGRDEDGAGSAAAHDRDPRPAPQPRPAGRRRTPRPVGQVRPPRPRSARERKVQAGPRAGGARRGGARAATFPRGGAEAAAARRLVADAEEVAEELLAAPPAAEAEEEPAQLAQDLSEAQQAIAALSERTEDLESLCATLRSSEDVQKKMSELYETQATRLSEENQRLRGLLADEAEEKERLKRIIRHLSGIVQAQASVVYEPRARLERRSPPSSKTRSSGRAAVADADAAASPPRAQRRRRRRREPREEDGVLRMHMRVDQDAQGAVLTGDAQAGGARDAARVPIDEDGAPERPLSAPKHAEEVAVPPRAPRSREFRARDGDAEVCFRVSWPPREGESGARRYARPVAVEGFVDGGARGLERSDTSVEIDENGSFELVQQYYKR